MKNLRINLFVAAMAGMLALVSCNPIEPSTYTTTFNRIVTVRNNGDVAWLSLDNTNQITLKNFRTSADMDAFGVHMGNRAIAQITFSTVANAGQGTFMLNRIDTIDFYNLDTAAPSDTARSYVRFDRLPIDASFTYPRIWTNGSFLNFTITHYSDYDKKNNVSVSLYPKELIADTLVLDLCVSVPGNSYRNEPSSTFLCYDLSSLRKPMADSITQVRVDSIVAGMLRLGLDSVYVKVKTADNLNIRDKKDSLISVSGASQITRFLFNF